MVVLGHIAGPYGVAGWVRVEPYTETVDALLGFHEWWLGRGEGDWRRAAVTGARAHGSGVVAQLAGIADRDAALALKGTELAVPRSALPAVAPGEMYREDLVGFAVVNRDGRMLGQVSGVTEHGAHPILQVRRDEGGATERLIPYVPAVIDGVDLDARRIEVDWGEDY